jgi:hypothetical protein
VERFRRAIKARGTPDRQAGGGDIAAAGGRRGRPHVHETGERGALADRSRGWPVRLPRTTARGRTDLAGAVAARVGICLRGLAGWRRGRTRSTVPAAARVAIARAAATALVPRFSITSSRRDGFGADCSARSGRNKRNRDPEDTAKPAGDFWEGKVSHKGPSRSENRDTRFLHDDDSFSNGGRRASRGAWLEGLQPAVFPLTIERFRLAHSRPHTFLRSKCRFPFPPCPVARIVVAEISHSERDSVFAGAPDCRRFVAFVLRDF